MCGSSNDIRVDDRRRAGECTEACPEREIAQAGSPFEQPELPNSPVSARQQSAPNMNTLPCVPSSRSVSAGAGSPGRGGGDGGEGGGAGELGV